MSNFIGIFSLSLVLLIVWSIFGAVVYMMEDYGGEKPKGSYLFLTGPITWIITFWEEWVKRNTTNKGK